MNEVTDFMGEDHGRLDEIFREFQAVKNNDLAKARTLFSQFNEGLQRHIVWEEEILFQLFENRTGMFNVGPTAVMRTEHRQMKQFLQAIQSSIVEGNSNTDELESELVEVLTAHNQKEENILYPWIDNSVTEQEREQVFVEMQNASAQ